MKTIRQVVAAGFASGALTDEQIRSQYELPTLRQRLARVRLLYVAKLWKEGPETLHKLIEIEHQHVVPSWKKQITKDVEWLRSVYDVDLGHETTWEHLTHVWQEDNNGWPTKVRRAVRHAARQEHAMSEVRAWHNDIITDLRPVVTYTPRHWHRFGARKLPSM